MATADFYNHFSEKNIPFGIASSETHKEPHAVTRLGNTVIFLQDLVNELFKNVGGLTAGVLGQSTLNAFAALPKSVHQDVRSQIQSAYQKGGLDAFPAGSKEDINDVTMHLPMEIKDFAGKITSPLIHKSITNLRQISPVHWTMSSTQVGLSLTTHTHHPDSSTSLLATKVAPAQSSLQAQTSSVHTVSSATLRTVLLSMDLLKRSIMRLSLQLLLESLWA